MERETERATAPEEGLEGALTTLPEPSVAMAESSAFAHDFRVALAAHRVSLRRLSLELAERGVEVGTALLAAWRSGTFAPAGHADHAAAVALEELLDLEPGHLACSVDAHASPQRPGSRRFSDLSGPLPVPSGEGVRTGGSQALESVRRARTALGFERTSGLLAESSVEVTLTIDENGVERHITQETQWVAQESGVDSFPVVLMTPVPVRTRSRVEPVRGCRLGPTYVDLAAGVFATALVLPAPLRAGQRVTTVHRTHLPDDVAPDMVYEHRLLRQVEQVSVGVAFDPECAPSSWYGYSSTDDDERGGEVVPVDGEVRVSRDDFGPGAVGLSWSW